MKTCLLVLGVVLIAASAHAADLKDIQQLSFMTGCWAVTENGSSTEEIWTAPSGGTMMGLSRTVKNSQTVFTEYMQVREQDGVLTMFVQLRMGEKVTAFKLTTMGNREALFTTGLAWPRQLLYRLEAGSLFAKLEGAQNGREVAQVFPYKRVKCD
jgi:hypothetical protein